MFLKTIKILFSLLSIFIFLPISTYAEEQSAIVQCAGVGDINGDGTINNKDLTRLFQYLSDWDVSVVENALDTNGDGEINNKDLTRLFQYLSDWDVTLGNGAITKTAFVYGKSENGRDLICYSIAPNRYTKTILLEFEIHGFEDEYDRDGQVLVDTANSLIEHYEHVDSLNGTRLLIVPSANPDGLADGTTNNGFGRCNAKGIDLNRDFDANYKPFSSSRNYTQSAFSGAESRALRDLYNEYKPDIVIDFHGWESSLIGDIELKQPFHEELGLRISNSFTSTNANGYFSNWAHQQGSLAMLVEFTSSDSVDIISLENAIGRLINDEYDNGENSGDYGVMENKSIVFMAPDTISLPNDEQGNPQYISKGDICLINSVDTELGICNVTYPSGGTNVFATGQSTKQATIKISNILGYNAGYSVTSGSTDITIKVYPTSEMAANGTNWSLDPGDKYYVLNQSGTSKAVMYYCSTGAHAGHYKIGWVNTSDIN